MKINTQKEIEQSNTADASQENLEPRTEEPGHLTSDQEFKELCEAYENADFDRCHKLLEQLKKPYPDHPILKNYREEIEIRQTVKSMTLREHEDRKTEAENIKAAFGIIRDHIHTACACSFCVFLFLFQY